MTRDEIVSATLEKLVASLGAGDPRVTQFQGDGSPAAIEGLLHAVLSDLGAESRQLSLSMWLACVYPSPVLAYDIVGVMKSRPTLALLAGAKLSRIRDRGSVGAVEAVLLDTTLSPECRAGAARALDRSRESSAMESLRRALHAPGQDAIVLNQVIQALGWIHIANGGRTDVARDIVALLDSESPDVRYSAILALGNMFAVEMIAPIAVLLDDDGLTSSGRSVRDEARRVVQLLSETRRHDNGIA